MKRHRKIHFRPIPIKIKGKKTNRTDIMGEFVDCGENGAEINGNRKELNQALTSNPHFIIKEEIEDMEELKTCASKLKYEDRAEVVSTRFIKEEVTDEFLEDEEELTIPEHFLSHEINAHKKIKIEI